MTAREAVGRLLARAELVGAAVYGQPAAGVVLCPAGGGEPVEVSLDDEAARRALAGWAARTDRVFCFERAAGALRALLERGVEVERPVCGRTLDVLGGAADAREGEGSGARALAPSSSSAADEAARAAASLGPRMDALDRRGARRVARLECLVLPAFAALEHRGLHVDAARWRALVADAKRAADAARAEVYALLGDAVPRDLFGHPDVSLDNDEQVKAAVERAIGEELPSISKDVLARLGHPVGAALIAFREAHKIVTTYGEAFLASVDDDGRIRATFIPLGASTGRVASRDPNLQNLPSGAAFHRCLSAPPGRAIVTADYATCELRILAELAEDPVFLRAFDDGEDLHAVIAQELFKQPVSKTENPTLRARAKAINFGLCYGMGAGALARSLDVSREEAEALLAAYFARFPRIRGYLEDSVDRALARGYAETLLGRRLVFDPARLDGEGARGELSRIAKNMPIQGTSADMTKLAMVRVREALRGFADAGLVNTIHDELVVECDAAEGEAVAAAVREAMEAAHRTLLARVPPVVDVHVGDHWVH